MYLHVPGNRPFQKTPYSNQLLALMFWSSQWGAQATERLAADPTLVITFLSASRDLGGMEASWASCDGLHGLLASVERERPFCLLTERRERSWGSRA